MNWKRDTKSKHCSSCDITICIYTEYKASTKKHTNKIYNYNGANIL